MSRTINGRFGRTLDATSFLAAGCTVAANAARNGVSLSVPAGGVSGSMDNDTALAVAAALVDEVGATSTPSPTAPASQDFTGWSIEVEDDGAYLLDANGITVHEFKRPPATTFVG